VVLADDGDRTLGGEVPDRGRRPRRSAGGIAHQKLKRASADPALFR
jgi:hypothetical protein